MSQVIGVAWYRFRTTFRRRFGGYLSVILLIGLIGGLSMGAVAGARRTESSFPIYLASTDPITAMVLTGFDDPALGQTSGYVPRLNKAIADLRFVRQRGDRSHLRRQYQPRPRSPGFIRIRQPEKPRPRSKAASMGRSAPWTASRLSRAASRIRTGRMKR